MKLQLSVKFYLHSSNQLIQAGYKKYEKDFIKEEKNGRYHVIEAKRGFYIHYDKYSKNKFGYKFHITEWNTRKLYREVKRILT
jgi:hypothetical protein